MAISIHGSGHTAPILPKLPVAADTPDSFGVEPDPNIQTQEFAQVIGLFKPKIRRRSPRRAMLPFKHVLAMANLAYVLFNSQLGGPRRASLRTRGVDQKLNRSATSLLEGLVAPLLGSLPVRTIVSKLKRSDAVGDQPRQGGAAGQQSTPPPWLPVIERQLGKMEYAQLESMRHRLAQAGAASNGLVREFARSLQGLGYDDPDVIGGARTLEGRATGPAGKISPTAKLRRKNTENLIRHLKNSLNRELSARDRPMQALADLVSQPYSHAKDIETAWRDLFDTVQLRWRRGETTPRFLAGAVDRLSDYQIGRLATSLFPHPSP
jgi:hypothetical protein